MLLSITNLFLSLNLPYYYKPNMYSSKTFNINDKFNANISPFKNKLIDIIYYNGQNIRQEIIKPYVKKNKKILDMCCGIGISTGDNSIGIDVSPEMLKVAKSLYENKYHNKKFYCANAESFNIKKNIDIVTCMFALHEIPLQSQIKIINNGISIAKEEFIILDISPKHNPYDLFILGNNPEVHKYLKNIDKMLCDFEETIIIPNQIHLWRFKK